MRSAGVFLWALSLFFFSSSVQAQATIKAFVNSNSIGQDDIIVFTLAIEDDNAIDEKNLQDFSRLTSSFAIVSRSERRSSTIINGAISHKLQIQLQLSPIKDGDVVIPAFNYKNSSTQPILIKYRSNGSLLNYEVLFVAHADKKEIFVGQPLNYYVDIKTNVILRNGQVNDLVVPNAFIKKLPETNSLISENGKQYRLYRFSYIIFPTQAGTIVIPERLLRARALPNGLALTKYIQRTTSAISVAVQPPPDFYLDGKGKAQSLDYWLPADDLIIEQSWQNNRNVVQGNIVSRVIKLKLVNGLASQIPKNLFGNSQAKGLTVYSDKPETKSNKEPPFTVIWQQKIDYLMQDAGVLTIPSLSIVWWKNRAQRFVVSKLDNMTINVKANANFQSRAKDLSRQGVTAANKNKGDSEIVDESKDNKLNAGNQIAIWQQIAWIVLWFVLFVCLALLVLVVSLRLRKIYRNNLQSQKVRERDADHIMQLLQSSDGNHEKTAGAISEVLCAWSRNYWHSHDTSISQWLASALNISPGHKEELENFVARVQLMYHTDAKTHNLADFSILIYSLLTIKIKPHKTIKKQLNPLPNLYPN